MEMTGTWVQETGSVTYLRRTCHFLRGGHGYTFSYSIAQAHALEHDALLSQIREATQFNR